MSNQITDIVIQGQRVVFEDRIEPAALVIQEGIIREIIGYGQPEAIDVGEAAILPGLIDPHVHLNEPGRTEWEGMATGTTAAAWGGITSLCDMPLNSAPVTTSVEALQQKRLAAAGQLSMDVGFHGGVVPGNVHEIASLLDAGVLGIKAFLCHSGIDDFPNVGEKELLEIMPILAARGVPLLAHAEIAKPLAAMSDPRRYADYLESRPPSFEREAIAMLIQLCRETRCPVHIVHLADAGSVAMLRDARANGLPITVETCPHYLTFVAEEIPDGATQFKCAPPIRNWENREGLWSALQEGVIDLIASDHSPCPPAMKSLDEGRFDQAWGGISSLQVGLPVIWAEAVTRGFGLADIVRWMSREPARLLGLHRGIQVGCPADLVIFDTATSWVVDGEMLYHRHKVTPYDRRLVRGLVRQTLVRGVAANPGHGKTIDRREYGYAKQNKTVTK
jgi:allantoinase